MEDDYEIEMAYAEDPVGTTNAVIAASAASAAAELAQRHDARRDAELARVQVAMLAQRPRWSHVRKGSLTGRARFGSAAVAYTTVIVVSDPAARLRGVSCREREDLHLSIVGCLKHLSRIV